MNKHKLKADPRKIFGKPLKKSRKEGLLPANVFGKKTKSVALFLDYKEFEKIFDEAGETGVIELSVNDTVHPVLVSNIQPDPVSGSYLHVDFKEIDLKEKVTAEVPVELVGESPAEKQGLGAVVVQLSEIEVEALPADLPEKFEVDVTALTEAGQMVLVSDLKYDKSKVEVKEDMEAVVVKVEEMKVVVEEVAPVAEVPAEGTEGAESNSAGAEGEKKEGETPAPEEKKE